MRGQRWGQSEVAGSCRIERVVNVKYCAAAQLCVCVSVPHKRLSKQTTRMSSYVPAIPLRFIG